MGKAEDPHEREVASVVLAGKIRHWKQDLVVPVTTSGKTLQIVVLVAVCLKTIYERLMRIDDITYVPASYN